MHKEIVQLELIRQQIEQEMYDSGSASDYIDRGNPDPRQLKQAMDFIASQENRIARLQGAFRIQLRKCDPEVIQEWVDLHKAILQRILTEKVTNAHTKTRHFVAKNTLDEWEKVQAGEADFVNINWHFLKDYKEEVRKLVNRKWWQVWK